MSDLELGANQERRRILSLILKQQTLHRLAGDERIAGVLDHLATTIEHDHRAEDAEQ